MFRVLLCALPLVISSQAGAQSFISVTGEAELEAPASFGPPMSITQRYVPSTAAQPRELSLLVDETQTVAAQPAPLPAITVTSNSPQEPRMAVNDLGIGRTVMVVTNVRGLNE